MQQQQQEQQQGQGGFTNVRKKIFIPSSSFARKSKSTVHNGNGNVHYVQDARRTQSVTSNSNNNNNNNLYYSIEKAPVGNNKGLLELPAELVTRLSQVGMETRKAVHNGYKTKDSYFCPLSPWHSVGSSTDGKPNSESIASVPSLVNSFSSSSRKRRQMEDDYSDDDDDDDVDDMLDGYDTQEDENQVGVDAAGQQPPPPGCNNVVDDDFEDAVFLVPRDQLMLD